MAQATACHIKGAAQPYQPFVLLTLFLNHKPARTQQYYLGPPHIIGTITKSLGLDQEQEQAGLITRKKRAS
jgi:hypothetical protein